MIDLPDKDETMEKAMRSTKVQDTDRRVRESE